MQGPLAPGIKLAGLKLPFQLALLVIFSAPVFAEKIVIISDINGSYGSTTYHARVSKAVKAIIELKPGLVIGAGDMVAGQKQPLLDRAHLDRMWASFNSTVADPLKESGIDFIISPGNHDGSALPGFDLEQERFIAQWKNRQPGLPLLEGSDWPARYALWFGKTLIISIDGTRPGRLQQADLDLLQTILKREGSNAQTIMVVSHLPQWSFAQGRENDIITDPALTDLLSRYEVDFFISGHHHVFYPGIDDNGVGHLAVGPLGGNVRKFIGQSYREPFSFVVLDACMTDYRISAMKAPGFTEEISWPGLPPVVTGKRGRLQRVDLVNTTSGEACNE
jgi:predicted phosphodiesterase